MPRDDWAKAKRKDIARKAMRTGEYFRVEKPKRKKRKRTQKAARPKPPSISAPAGGTIINHDSGHCIHYNHTVPAKARVRTVLSGDLKQPLPMWPP